jgi:hypothetical protein
MKGDGPTPPTAIHDPLDLKFLPLEKGIMIVESAKSIHNV